MRRALWWSAGAHLLLVILLSLSFTFSHKRPIGANVQIVQATLISEADLNPQQPQKNQQKKRAEEQKKQRELAEQRQEEARQQQAEKLQQQAREAALAEQKRVAAEAAAEAAAAAAAQEAIKKKALQDQKAQQVKEAKLKAEQANKRKAEEARQKAEAEQKRKAEEAKRKADDAKKKAEEAQKKAQAEKKRKADELAKKAEAEKKRQADAKKKAEADKKRKELDKLEQQMQQELAAEMAAMESAQSAVAEGETDQWLMAIMGKVQRNLNSDSIVGKKCVLPIRVTKGGLVLNIGSGQGDRLACEESVRAIKKAEPLPMPPSDSVFKALCKGTNPCEINLHVEPER